VSSGENDLAAAFIDALDDATINRLFDRLLVRASRETIERLAGRLGPYLAYAATDRWMTTDEAALYLALTRNALHKLTAARAIPFTQDCRGGKLYFKRSELDAWRTRTTASHR
jgi:excisionase family DNA binding protein